MIVDHEVGLIRLERQRARILPLLHIETLVNASSCSHQVANLDVATSRRVIGDTGRVLDHLDLRQDGRVRVVDLLSIALLAQRR